MSEQKIYIDDQLVFSRPNETLLQALLRNEVDINHGCHQGVCQSCMLRSLEGVPPAQAQNGLKQGLIKQNYFLACLCYPQQTMRVARSGYQNFVTYGSVIVKQQLSPDILLITLLIDDPLDYYAGQFVNLQRADGLSRSYSIANNRNNNQELSFHIRCLQGGKFSEWVHQQLKIGDRLAVSEAQGQCYYLPDRPDQPLLLIGTGSGLAPLAGIISEAMDQGHRGDIHLYHGSRDINGLYCVEQMQNLAETHHNFHYTACISQGDTPEKILPGRANNIAFGNLPDLNGWKVFLCGHPEMVNHSKQQAFLNGAAFNDIYADAFHVTPTDSG